MYLINGINMNVRNNGLTGCQEGATSMHQNNEEYVHPVYRRISAANGRINKMTKPELLEALSYLKLGTRGTKEILQKRLKADVKRQHLMENNILRTKSNYVDYYIVIDFEATCVEPNPPGYRHEIIEFPAVLVNAKSLEIVDEFHMFCRPTVNPVLSDFCKSLTGIRQTQVDTACLFSEVLEQFDIWLKGKVTPLETFCVATDGKAETTSEYHSIMDKKKDLVLSNEAVVLCIHGSWSLYDEVNDAFNRAEASEIFSAINPWDMNRFIKLQCKSLKLQIPHYFHRWVNIRKHFSNYYKLYTVNVELMLQHLGMEFQGRPHSGIDDSRNIARILIQLIKDGANATINEELKD